MKLYAWSALCHQELQSIQFPKVYKSFEIARADAIRYLHETDDSEFDEHTPAPGKVTLTGNASTIDIFPVEIVG